MSYRVLKISNFYTDYLAAVRPRLDEAGDSYELALQKLLDDSFSWSDFYGVALKKLGYEVIEVVENADWVQEKWAKQEGHLARGLELVEAQIGHYKPEILFFDTITIPRGWISSIRKKFPEIKKVGIFNCSPASVRTLELFKETDFVITCHRGINEDYRKLGLNSFHIFHGFGRSILSRLGKPEGEVGLGGAWRPEILFSGSLFGGSQFHDERLALLESFCKQGLPLSIFAQLDSTPDWKVALKRFLYHAVKTSAPNETSYLRQLDIVRRVAAWKEPPKKPKLSRVLSALVRPPLFGLEMYKALSQSRVVFNIHGGIAGRYASNMRMFEATGVASCLLTDHKDDLGDLFELDNEVVVYSSAEECLEKARWLLDNPAKANQIAIAGQRRTLKDHTYERRAEDLDRVFRRILGRN